MEKQIITKLSRTFEDMLKKKMDLSSGLQVEKAKVSCKKSGNGIFYHFVDAANKVTIGTTNASKKELK